MRNISSFYWNRDNCHLFLLKHRQKRGGKRVRETHLHIHTLFLISKVSHNGLISLQNLKKIYYIRSCQMSSHWEEAALRVKKQCYAPRRKKKRQPFQRFAAFSVSRSYYNARGSTGQASLLQPQAELLSPMPPTLSPPLPFLWQFLALVNARKLNTY